MNLMKKQAWMTAAAAVGGTAVLLLALSAALAPAARRNAEKARGELLALLLPGSGSFVPEPTGGAEFVIDAWKGEHGFVVETATQGYAGEVVLLVGVDMKGRVTGLVVRDMEETYGLGMQALWDTNFLAQFLHTSGDAAVGENVDALTGATVTSKAITKAINAASAFVTGTDVDSGATQWEG